MFILYDTLLGTRHSLDSILKLNDVGAKLDSVNHTLDNQTMDYLKNLTGTNSGEAPRNEVSTEQGGRSTETNASGGGGFMGKINNAMGGGAAGEKKEGKFPVYLLALQLTENLIAY